MQRTTDGGYIMAGRSDNYGAAGTNGYLVRLIPPPPYMSDLALNDTMFTPGEPFRLTLRTVNNTATAKGVHLYVVLDVYGSYFFWPSWRSSPPDFKARNLAPNSDNTENILNFTWPAGVGSASGIKVWHAMLDASTQQLLYDVDMVEFSYSS